MWSVGGEEREVAVKSLADGSTKEKRVQSLQEAAIMGQFKHPNVTALHGVLLDCSPVRQGNQSYFAILVISYSQCWYIVELMKKGDLIEYLLQIRLR